MLLSFVLWKRTRMGNAVRDDYMELTVCSFYLQTYPEQSSYFRAHVQLFSVTEMQAEVYSLPSCHGSEYLHISLTAAADFLFCFK